MFVKADRNDVTGGFPLALAFFIRSNQNIQILRGIKLQLMLHSAHGYIKNFSSPQDTGPTPQSLALLTFLEPHRSC